MNTSESTVRTSERELEIAREYDAPAKRVWQAWADADQVVAWYGPAGFRVVTHERDFRAGGLWRFTMIGPDGHEYPNLVRYVEVIEPSLLRYSHGSDQSAEPVRFEMEVRFEALSPTRTRLVMRSRFPSANALRHVVEQYGAIEGARQTQARLAEHLASLPGAPGSGAGDAGAARPFVLTRHFAAPRERVWAAWTTVEALGQWMSPAGCTTIHAQLDLRAGGRYHYGLRTPDGKEMWGMWIFREVSAPSRLVTVNSFSDAAGGLTRHPLAADWPAHTLSTIDFLPHAGKGGGTTLQLRWEPCEATPAEIALFNASHAGMEHGWGGTMAQLEAWLARG